MCEVYTPQPVTASSHPFVAGNPVRLAAEPDLGELMRDPMTQALMAADRVDHRALCALISQVRDSLAAAR